MKWCFLFSQMWSFVLSSLVLESISSFCKLPAAEPIHLILLDRPGLKLRMSWASCAGRHFFTTGKGPVAVSHSELQYWERKEKRHSQRWDSKKLLFYNISKHFRGNFQNRQSLGQNTGLSVCLIFTVPRLNQKELHLLWNLIQATNTIIYI